MVKSVVMLAAFAMLFTQFVHAAVVDATDGHHNHNHFHIVLNDAHNHHHSDWHDVDHDQNHDLNHDLDRGLDHNDDHGLGSLHNSMHDLQNIALPESMARPAKVLTVTTRSMPVSDLHSGLTLSPPVPPPLA